MEEKLALSHSELQEVKSSIKQYESLLDSYKIQVQYVKSVALQGVQQYGCDLRRRTLSTKNKYCEYHWLLFLDCLNLTFLLGT